MKIWKTKKAFSPYQLRIKIETPEDEEALWELAEAYPNYNGVIREILIKMSNTLGEERYKNG